MDTRRDMQQSTIFWVLFIGMAIIIALLLVDKYAKLQKDLKVAKARSLVASLTSASATNFTQRQHDHLQGVALKNCNEVTTIGGNTLPPGYQIFSQKIAPGAIVNCLLDGPKIDEVQFSVIGID